MINRKHLLSRRVAFATLCGFMLSAGEASAAGQGAAQNGSSAVNHAGSNAAKAVSDASIADGTKNQQEGQATQNMAQMATGAMQIAQGLLGLLGAAAAKKKGDTSDGRAADLTNLNQGIGPGGTAPTPPSITTSDLGTVQSVTSDLGAESLRKEPLNGALTSIEKNYGIPRDAFVEALKNGMDPKEIFARAPKNPISPGLLQQVSAGLAASDTAAQAAEAAKSIADNAGNLVSAGGAGTGAPSGETAAARAPASSTSESFTPEEFTAPGNIPVSPEIKAAMAAKADQLRREKEMKEVHSWSIFQLVANRYRKLEPMLYGRVEKTNPNPVPSQIRN